MGLLGTVQRGSEVAISIMRICWQFHRRRWSGKGVFLQKTPFPLYADGTFTTKLRSRLSDVDLLCLLRAFYFQAGVNKYSR